VQLIGLHVTLVMASWYVAAKHLQICVHDFELVCEDTLFLYVPVECVTPILFYFHDVIVIVCVCVYKEYTNK
jgi:hypothetical protein